MVVISLSEDTKGTIQLKKCATVPCDLWGLQSFRFGWQAERLPQSGWLLNVADEMLVRRNATWKPQKSRQMFCWIRPMIFSKYSTFKLCNRLRAANTWFDTSSFGSIRKAPKQNLETILANGVANIPRLSLIHTYPYNDVCYPTNKWVAIVTGIRDQPIDITTLVAVTFRVVPNAPAGKISSISGSLGFHT